MNLKKILIVSFLVLVISTYQSDSGIILSLLLKVLLLKGALFMSMPLSIGAFMMGQGMGFFAGNMMGGYMMLKAANRYHNKEKTKWTSGYGGHGHDHHYGHHSVHYKGWGWKPSYEAPLKAAYHKGKTIGTALHGLTAHKTKIIHVLGKIKAGLLGTKAGFLKGHGWGWKPRPKPHGYSWGWHKPYHHHHHHHGDYHYASHTNDQPSYDTYPYAHLDNGETAIYLGTGSKAASSPTASVTSTSYASSGPYENEAAALEAILGGQLDHSAYYPAQGTAGASETTLYDIVPSLAVGQSHSGGQHGAYSGSAVTQDPTNTYYTSAYGGPGHEYTGILTSALGAQQESQPTAMSKSSEEKNYLKLMESMGPTASVESTTYMPNPLLEKYLEQRLAEEAAKQNNIQKQEEVKQVIELLRKAYLKELLVSLKEEEQLNAIPTSTESARGYRSVENKDYAFMTEILKQMKSTEAKHEEPDFYTDMQFSESRHQNVVKYPMMGTMANSKNQAESDAKNSNFNPVFEKLMSSASYENYVSSSERPDYLKIFADTTTSSPISEQNTQTKGDKGPDAMWVKVDNTFQDESLPFTIRMKRNTEAEAGDSDTKGDSASTLSATQAQEQIQSFIDDIKKFFTLLTVLDQDQCLQKLVCDVHTNQKDPNSLTQYEKNILTTFKLMKALMPEGEEDSSSKYRRAALIGETGQSLELCQQTYSTCGFSSSQIITLGTQASSSTVTPTASTAATTDYWSQNQGDKLKGSGSARSDFVTMPRVRRSWRSLFFPN